MLTINIQDQEGCTSNIFTNLSLLDLSRRQRATLPNILAFLEEHRPIVGEILLGRAAGQWKKKDVRSLERLVGNKVLSRRAIEDYLLVLRKACRVWALRKRVFAHLPRIPIQPPETKTPFRLNFPKALKRYEAWKRALAESINASLPAKRNEVRIPVPVTIEDLLLSSILFGGLHSSRQVVALVRAVNQLLERLICADGRMHVEMYLSWHGVPDVEFRRWQPDPLSATLLMRVHQNGVAELLAPEQGKPCSEKDIMKRLGKRLQAKFPIFAGAKDRALVTGIGALLQAAQIVGYKELPVLLAEYAASEIMCHSFPRATLRRISSDKLELLPQEHKPCPNKVIPMSSTTHSHLLRTEDSNYVTVLKRALEGSNHSEVRATLQAVTDNPFLRRMVDFADYLLAVPSSSGKLPSVAAVKGRVVRVARHIGYLAKEKDLAELPTDALEVMYVQALAETGADNFRGGAEYRLRHNLAIGLRALHEYMRVVWNKEPLSDRAILFCGDSYSDVDAEFLTVEEYQSLLGDIDTKLRDDLTETERRVARIAVILGYRCGLRRLEALHLTVQEVLVDRHGYPIELLLYPSESRGLKSRNAWRRIPLRIIPRAELNELYLWLCDRNIRDAQPGEYVFADVHQGFVAPSQKTFNYINSLMPGNAHFHGLRHSAGTGFISRLILAELDQHEDLFTHRSETMNWLRSGGELRQIVYRNNQPTRKHPYKLAEFLGHGCPQTSYAYVHLMDWLLAVGLKQTTSMRPSHDLVRKASGVARSTYEGWEKEGAAMAIPLNLFRKQGGSNANDAVDAKPKVASCTRNWVEELRSFLHALAKWGRPLREVAARYSVDPSIAERLAQQAEYVLALESQPGVRRHRGEEPEGHPVSGTKGKMICPIASDQPYDKVVVGRFAEALEMLGGSEDLFERAMFTQALSTFVHRVWHHRDRVMFHSLDEAGEAKNYVAFLRRTGISLKDIGWYSFDHSTRSQHSVAWRRELGLEEYKIEILPSPNPLAGSTRSWFGIMPKFKFLESEYPLIENPGAYGFRYLMVMGYIKFGER